jgi:hypothetical protein
LGGLRAAHARVRDANGRKGIIEIPGWYIEHNSLLPTRPVTVEKLM